MRFPPRNVQYLVMDRRVVGHLAQFASEKAQRSSVVLEVKCKPMSIMPLTYLKILQTIFKCMTVGACMNCDAKFTLYERSGLVRVRYYKAPTNPLK